MYKFKIDLSQEQYEDLCNILANTGERNLKKVLGGVVDLGLISSLMFSSVLEKEGKLNSSPMEVKFSINSEMLEKVKEIQEVLKLESLDQALRMCLELGCNHLYIPIQFDKGIDEFEY